MKKILPYIAAVLIAAGAFFTGSVTDFGDALDVALDKEKAKAECIKLLEGNTDAVAE